MKVLVKQKIQPFYLPGKSFVSLIRPLYASKFQVHLLIQNALISRLARVLGFLIACITCILSKDLNSCNLLRHLNSSKTVQMNKSNELKKLKSHDLLQRLHQYCPISDTALSHAISVFLSSKASVLTFFLTVENSKRSSCERKKDVEWTATACSAIPFSISFSRFPEIVLQ